MNNIPTENLKYWADVGDNRIGPLLRELVEALEDCDDEMLSRISNRLKFMSSSIQTYRHNKRKGLTSGR